MRQGDGSLLSDPRAQRQLRRAIGLSGAIVFPLALIWVALGAALRQAPLAAVVTVGIAFGAWLVVEYRTSRYRAAEVVAKRTALVANVAQAGADHAGWDRAGLEAPDLADGRGRPPHILVGR
jgi:hypothetical protein